MPEVVLALAPRWTIHHPANQIKKKKKKKKNNSQNSQISNTSNNNNNNNSNSISNSMNSNCSMFPWWNWKNPKVKLFDLCRRATSTQQNDISLVGVVVEFQQQLKRILQQHPTLIHAVDDVTGQTVLHFVCGMAITPTTLEFVETLISISEAVHDYNLDHNINNNKNNQNKNKKDELLLATVPVVSTVVPRSFPTMAPLLLIPCARTGALPLHVACQRQQRQQRQRHQDQQQRHDEEDESLYYAMIHHLLTCHPAAVSARDSNGNVPLHSACNNASNSLRVIQMLVDTWKDALWAPNQQGNLPIHLFLKWNRNVKRFSSGHNMAIFHYLVVQQAPSTLTVRNHAEHTPYDILACGSLYNPEFHPMAKLIMETEQKLQHQQQQKEVIQTKKRNSFEKLQSLALIISTTEYYDAEEEKGLELDGVITDEEEDENDDDLSLTVEVQDEDCGGELTDIEDDDNDNCDDNDDDEGKHFHIERRLFVRNTPMIHNESCVKTETETQMSVQANMQNVDNNNNNNNNNIVVEYEYDPVTSCFRPKIERVQEEMKDDGNDNDDDDDNIIEYVRNKIRSSDVKMSYLIHGDNCNEDVNSNHHNNNLILVSKHNNLNRNSVTIMESSPSSFAQKLMMKKMSNNPPKNSSVEELTERTCDESVILQEDEKAEESLQPIMLRLVL